MGMKRHQWSELIGVALVLAATAAQVFYLEPLKRQIEWRLSAFYSSQSAQIHAKEILENRIIFLKTLNAPASQIQAAQDAQELLLDRYRTSDANIADIVLSKENVETILQYIIIGLFALGTLLTAVGRAIEMRTANRSASELPSPPP